MIILWIDWATKKLEMLAIFVGCSAHWPLKNKVWSMTESSFLSWSSGVLYPDGLKRIHWKSTAGPNQIHVLRRSRWFSFGKVSQTDVRGPVVKKKTVAARAFTDGIEGYWGLDGHLYRHLYKLLNRKTKALKANSEKWFYFVSSATSQKYAMCA